MILDQVLERQKFERQQMVVDRLDHVLTEMEMKIHLKRQQQEIDVLLNDKTHIRPQRHPKWDLSTNY